MKAIKEEVLSVDNIQIQERSCDWKSAIETAVKPLIQNGFVEEKYTAAILRNIEAWGPYFMAGPYIILPHARPEEGVRKNQISILSLKKPVYFDDGTIPIRLLMILASVDSKSHLRILKMLASVVTDETTLRSLLKSNTPQELFQCFQAKESKGGREDGISIHTAAD